MGLHKVVLYFQKQRRFAGRWLLTIVVLGLVGFVPPVAAQQQNQRTPIELLLDNADFWYEHGQENVALQTYQRVLSYDSGNKDALIGAARMALDVGQTELARTYIGQLQTISPKDPAVAALRAIEGRTAQQVADLTQARHLATAGQRKPAIARYKSLFKNGQIPDDLAGEYYFQILQEVEDGSVESEDIVDKMTAIAQAHPNDLNYRLALAHCLVLLGDHRPDAIDIYAKLAREPALTARVRPMWREAILWSGIDIRAREQLIDYLSLFPSDPDLDAVQAKMKTDLPSRALMAVLLGNTEADDGKFAEAEATYKHALALDPNEVQSYVMMAVLLAKTGRMAEAKTYAHHAAQMAPDKRDPILSIVREGNAMNARENPEAMRQILAKYHEVIRLADAGQNAEAEALLRKLMGSNEDPGSLMMLADLRHRAGDDAAQFTLLQRAVTLAPKNGDALLTLSAVQAQHGQLDAAQSSYDRADAALRGTDDKDKLQTLRQVHGELLRQLALHEPDLAKRLQMLRQAVTNDPDNGWTRLALARSLEDQNKPDEAATAIAPVQHAAEAADAARTISGGEAIQIAFIWADGHNSREQSIRLALLLPEAKRSRAMLLALTNENLRRQVASLLVHTDSLRQLRLLAAQPDPEGTRGLIIGKAVLRARGVAAMRMVLADGLNATPAPANVTKLRYAGLLVENHQFGAANALLSGVDPKGLDTLQLEEFEHNWDFLVAAEVGQWLQNKDIARAEKTLARRRSRITSSTVLKTTAARITIARGNPAAALATLQEMLDRDPTDANIRGAAIDAAIGNSELRRAATLASDGMRLNPDNPFLAVQAGTVAHQLHRDSEALDDLRKARELRIDELSQDLPIPAATTTAAR